MSDAYRFIVNMPGYLPDNGPDVIFGRDNAKRYVVDELLSRADHYAESGDETAAEQLTNMAEDVNLSGRDGWGDVLDPAEGASWSFELAPMDDDATLEDVAEHSDSVAPHDPATLWDIAVDYCTGDDLGTPTSAWGPRASNCAPAAVALAWIYWDGTGDTPKLATLDDCMGQVVNDESGHAVAVSILNNLHAFDDVGENVAVDVVRDMVERDNVARDIAAIILHARELYDDDTAVAVAEIIRDTF